MTDQELMAAIRTKYGPAIASAVETTTFPVALLAALTANETGLDSGSIRFEPKVAGDLLMVLIGRKANYGAITRSALVGWFPPNFTPSEFAGALINLASSWGPTQIMGYQALANDYALSDIAGMDFSKHYRHAVEMLEDFAKRFHLSPPTTGDTAAPYFRCWNAGSPNGTTADPNYVANGLNRMTLYEEEQETPS
jgi:hypothetical protein